MVKRYCDVCEIPIVRNYVSNRLSGGTKMGDKIVNVTITLGVSTMPGTWNSGELCLTCLKAAVIDRINFEAEIYIPAVSRQEERDA